MTPSRYAMRAIYIAKGSPLLPPDFASMFDDLASSSLDAFFDPSRGLINLPGLTLGIFSALSFSSYLCSFLSSFVSCKLQSYDYIYNFFFPFSFSFFRVVYLRNDSSFPSWSGTFKFISKCIGGKGFSGTKRYFGDLGKSVS